MPPTLTALLDLLADLPDDTLADCYNLRRGDKAPLDVAFFAWRDAGSPRVADVDPDKILGPWESDTDDDAGEGWVLGRVRRNRDGDDIAYTGTWRGEPMWGVHGATQDTRGTEADADRLLEALGYTLREGPAGAMTPGAFPTAVGHDEAGASEIVGTVTVIEGSVRTLDMGDL